jgi:hypothetical protein
VRLVYTQVSPGHISTTMYINVYRLAQALFHCSLVTPRRHVLNGLVPLQSTSLYV